MNNVYKPIQNNVPKSNFGGIRKIGKRCCSSVYRFFIGTLFIRDFMQVNETLLKQLLYLLGMFFYLHKTFIANLL